MLIGTAAMHLSSTFLYRSPTPYLTTTVTTHEMPFPSLPQDRSDHPGRTSPVSLRARARNDADAAAATFSGFEDVAACISDACISVEVRTIAAPAASARRRPGGPGAPSTQASCARCVGVVSLARIDEVAWVLGAWRLMQSAPWMLGGTHLRGVLCAGPLRQRPRVSLGARHAVDVGQGDPLGLLARGGEVILMPPPPFPPPCLSCMENQ